MVKHSDLQAWLEADDGKKWSIGANCTIGRSPSNAVVIEDKKVSRRHAVIHKQDRDEYWVVDLGSGNGSFVNGRRVTLPSRLKKKDVLTFGDAAFSFHQRTASREKAHSEKHFSMTLIDVKGVNCWLLLVDIIGSTKLASQLPSTQWATLVGSWGGECRRIVDLHGGVINKYLGDGFLAIWPVNMHPVEHVSGALAGLQELQSTCALPFRMVVHRGEVSSGGGHSLGEESLSGIELIMVFRMERLASSLQKTILASEAAFSELSPHIELVSAGAYELPGFIDTELRNFYSSK